MSMKLAEFLPDRPTRLWHLVKQMGVDSAVGPLPREENGLPPWDFVNLMHMKKRYEDFGFDLQVIESAPPMNRIKLGLPGRDEEIETVRQFLANMGALHIPVWCYNFMAQIGWFRTSTTTRTRGGALVSSYDHAVMQDAPLTEAGDVGEDRLWENLRYFLERIVPVAEQAHVRLALHPDDPPVSPLRGIGRILRSADALERAVNLVPSAFSGITLCQGTMASAGEDIPALIRRFSDAGKIFFVHFRDVRGHAEHFVETFHDDGKTDMFAAMKLYVELGYDGPARSDHVPTMEGEDNSHPGYETLGRLFGVGYLRGLLEAAHKTVGRQ